MERTDTIIERPLPPGKSYEDALELVERGCARSAIVALRARTVFVPWDPRPHGWLVTLHTAAYLEAGDGGHLRAALRAAGRAIEALGEVVGEGDGESEERDLLVTVYSSRGTLRWLLGQLDAAADDMEQALFLAPDDEDVAGYLGEIYADMGRMLAA